MDTQASIIFLQQCTTWLEKIATAKQKELYYSLEKQARAKKKAVEGVARAITGAKNVAPAAPKPTRVQSAGARRGNPRNARARRGLPAVPDAANPGWFSRHPVLTATLGAAGGGALAYAMTPGKYSGLANAYAGIPNTNPSAADLTSYYGAPNDNSAATAFVNSYYGASGR